MAERLTEWAKRKRIHPKTAYRMYAENRMPVPTERFSERVILVHDPEYGKPIIPEKVAIYARVSSNDQKQDLDGQVSRITQNILKLGLKPDLIITEIGSGLNDNRPKYAKLLEDITITTIIVEHRERLTRFGYSTVERLLKTQNRKLIATDDKEIESDLVRDMVELLTSFAGRLYGQRSAKNRADRAIEKLGETI